MSLSCCTVFTVSCLCVFISTTESLSSCCCSLTSTSEDWKYQPHRNVSAILRHNANGNTISLTLALLEAVIVSVTINYIATCHCPITLLYSVILYGCVAIAKYIATYIAKNYVIFYDCVYILHMHLANS